MSRNVPFCFLCFNLELLPGNYRAIAMGRKCVAKNEWIEETEEAVVKYLISDVAAEQASKNVTGYLQSFVVFQPRRHGQRLSANVESYFLTMWAGLPESELHVIHLQKHYRSPLCHLILRGLFLAQRPALKGLPCLMSGGREVVCLGSINRQYEHLPSWHVQLSLHGMWLWKCSPEASTSAY